MGTRNRHDESFELRLYRLHGECFKSGIDTSVVIFSRSSKHSFFFIPCIRSLFARFLQLHMPTRKHYAYVHAYVHTRLSHTILVCSLLLPRNRHCVNTLQGNAEEVEFETHPLYDDFTAPVIMNAVNKFYSHVQP